MCSELTSNPSEIIKMVLCRFFIYLIFVFSPKKVLIVLRKICWHVPDWLYLSGVGINDDDWCMSKLIVSVGQMAL